MMDDRRKSDKPTVATKFSNKGGDNKQSAEGAERSGLTKGKPAKQNMCRTQCRAIMQSELERVRKAAQRDKSLQFNSLMHHVYNLNTLCASFYSLKRDAAPGVDGVTWRKYEENLEESLLDLSRRLARGGYRAKPVQRRFIPKEDGKRQRPLGVTVLEDKIVQRATVEVLNAIYETDFLGFSYGYRPGKSQHDCLDALYVGLLTRKVNYVLDCDLRGFFDTISHEWLLKFIEHRIADKRIIRLIKKWLNAGVLEDGMLKYTKDGTPQGGSASPFLANVYLHYCFDLWAQKWRESKAWGDMIVVRWADDIVVGFQGRKDAYDFKQELMERLAKFNLELNPDKTKIIEFGSFAIDNARKRGGGKPGTFGFLGFTHICGKKRSNGMFTVIRKTRKKKMRAKLKQVKFELRRQMHDPVPEVGKWLRSVVSGHFRYYGVPMNERSLKSFRFRVVKYWWWTLRRRSQKTKVTWERMERLVDRWIPYAAIHHPYPLHRFGVITQGRSPVR
jgi:group II intron reverse transcriptase/maturase